MLLLNGSRHWVGSWRWAEYFTGSFGEDRGKRSVENRLPLSTWVSLPHADMRSLIALFSLWVLNVFVAAHSNKCGSGTHNTQFVDSLVGKSFAESMNCYRPVFGRSVRVLKDKVLYSPYFNYRFRPAPSIAACPPYYVLHFQGNKKRPFINYFAPVKTEDFYFDFPSTFSSSEFNRKCPLLQYPVAYSVFGPTRRNFVDIVRTMVKDLSEMRDQICGQFNKKPANPTDTRYRQIDMIVKFLRSLAHDNFFCV